MNVTTAQWHTRHLQMHTRWNDYFNVWQAYHHGIWSGSFASQPEAICHLLRAPDLYIDELAERSRVARLVGTVLGFTGAVHTCQDCEMLRTIIRQRRESILPGIRLERPDGFRLVVDRLEGDQVVYWSVENGHTTGPKSLRIADFDFEIIKHDMREMT